MKSQESIQKKYIKIRNLQTIGNKLTVELDSSNGIRKYFKSNNLFVQYDKSVEKIDKSILFIPPLSAVITVAWATGADVYVESIDINFLESLRKVEPRFKKWFPRFMFSTNVHVHKKYSVVSNKSISKRSALLFTGGVDSLASYLKHRDEKPTLISIWGADIPTAEVNYWNRVRTKLADFARQEKVKIHFIKTNSAEIVNENLLKDFLGTKNWWLDVAHGLVLTGVSAPLLANDFATLLFASAQYPKSYQGPSGSHFFLDVAVSFGNTRVVYDCSELTRHEKVKYIFKSSPSCYPYLIVCYDTARFYRTQRALNCGTCEKCLRTLASLTLESIDPGDCNFAAQGTDGNFNLTKAYLEHGIFAKDKMRLLVWKDIQRYALQNLRSSKNMLPCAEVFFKWFGNFDLDKHHHAPNEGVSKLFKHFYLTRCRGAKFTVGRSLDAIVRKLQCRVARAR